MYYNNSINNQVQNINNVFNFKKLTRNYHCEIIRFALLFKITAIAVLLVIF